MDDNLGTRMPHDGDEALSYALASFMARFCCSIVQRRYALVEAKTASARLGNDEAGIVELVARELGWKIKRVTESGKPEFRVSFHNYLTNTVHLHESVKWRMINQPVRLGWVALNQHSVARLLQEEIYKHITALIAEKPRVPLPEGIKRFTAHLDEKTCEKYPESATNLPKDVWMGAFPPCMQKLCTDAQNGRHLGHDGRFMICTFLLTVGMDENKVVDIFSHQNDFKRDLTEYYVHHIAFSGCGEIYTPPMCSSLRASGLCAAACGVKHPLVYYRKKCRTRR